MTRSGLALALLALGLTTGLAHAGAFTRMEGSDLGPSMESVTAVFEDRAGFLWIGSREGLALFDGYSAVVFEHDVSDPHSISDNNIRTVFEDSEGTIWIGTNTGGLERLDRDTWRFEHHRHDSQDPNSLPHDSVYAIVQESESEYWIGTQGGLARFDARQGTFERFPAGSVGTESDYIVALRRDEDGTLWIATADGGLSRRDPRTGRFRTFRHDPSDPGSIVGDGVYSIARDRSGHLWLATDQGVSRFDPGPERFRSIEFERFVGRSEPLATAVTVDREGHVWAATLDSGLWRLESRGESAVFRRHPFLTSYSNDSDARIVSAMADRAGNVWVGTWSEGLGRVSPRSRPLSRGPGSEPPGEVSSVLVGGDGRVWIGTLNARVEVHAAGSDARSIDIANLPLRMVEARGAIWIGSSNGLLRLDPDTESIRRYAHDPSDPESLGRGWAWSVHEDRRGRLWVGTGEGGLHRLLDDGRFAHYTHEAENPASLSDNYVTVIGEAPDGRLWVGTRSGGLNAFDPERSEFRRFLPDPADDMSLSHHSVSAILFDGGGSMWVGTAGGGLNHAVKDARGEVTGFERITEREGLISNNVVSLLEDEDGSLWIGTRRGLSRFDPADGRFVNYGTADGLASAEMTAGAAAAGRDSLYFGTHRGVTAVRKGTPFPDVAPSPTVVTAIRIVGGRQPAERPAPIDPDFTIPWGRILSFEFSVLDYGDRRRHRYQYRISGRRDEWIDLGSRHEITFADLDPGRYDLSVRGRNDQGVWSELDQPIRIEVVPPFWMTTWFRFLIVASIVGAAIGSHQFRMTRLARRNRELEDLKNQREMALEEARKSQEALHGAYDRLRRLTRRLEVAKEEERKHLARELHDEMGQALTTAKLNLQLFSGSEGLEDRNRRVTETLSLLDRMIVHVRALSLDLRPPLLDELGLSAALRGYTEALTRRSGVRVDLVIDSIPRDVPTEVEIAAFRVVQESLTNVLRHSGARRAEVNVRYDPSGFELRVEDDGRGFDVGAALERAVGGEHVGLLGMRERVESMGGALTVDSAPGTGTRIQARIPVAL